MGNEYVLVMDAGTSRARCHIFDQRARIVASAARNYSYTADEESGLARSFDPETLWDTCCELIKECMARARVQPKDIAVVTATSQRQGVAFLDEAGREVYIGPNLDLRALFEGAAIDQEMREKVYETTGHLPSFLFAPAKLRWFQIHQPDAYGRIACVLTLADWLRWRMTGVQVSEATLAAEAGLLDIHRRDWCTDLLEVLGLTTYDIPLAEAGQVAGAVQSEAAQQTGLAEGTPAAVAGADSQCGLLGMGVFQESQVGIVAGWSAPVEMITASPVLPPEGRTWAGCYLANDRWVLESSVGDAGNAYNWLANTLFAGSKDPFGEMENLSRNVPIGSEGAQAFLGPQRMDVSRLGMKPGGLLFPVPLTFSELGRGHLVRATLEAIAYALRANVEQLEGLASTRAAEIAIGGGMTRTKTFARTLADVLGTKVKASPEPEVSALGAYLCARTGLGHFASLKEAAANAGPDLKEIEPDPRDSAEYEDYYQRWLEIGEKLQMMNT